MQSSEGGSTPHIEPTLFFFIFCYGKNMMAISILNESMEKIVTIGPMNHDLEKDLINESGIWKSRSKS